MSEPPAPLQRHALANSAYNSTTVAVRDDARVRYAVPVLILLLLHVAWVAARSGQANPQLTREGLRLVQLADKTNGLSADA